MRKYSICFLLLLTAAALGFALGYSMTRSRVRYETAIPDPVYETETAADYQVVIRQEPAETAPGAPEKERYYLVSETGYLLVVSENDDGECLRTHIPVTDFPLEEQDRLREGIWFESMMEVLFYLESYTS